MRKYSALLPLILMVCLQNLYAQNSSESSVVRYVVFGTFTLPHGQFGSSIGNGVYITRRNGYYFGNLVGLASDGWGLGAEVYLPIKAVDGLDWLFSGQFLVNSPNVSQIKSIYQHDIGDSSQLGVNFSDWYNIPIMTGMKYQQDIIDGLGLYAEVQGGINISMEPNRVISVGSTVSEDTKFDPYIGFGFGAGVGVVILNRYNLSARYLDMDTPSFTGTRTLSPKYFPTIVTLQSNVLGDQRRVDMFQIILGIEL